MPLVGRAGVLGASGFPGDSGLFGCSHQAGGQDADTWDPGSADVTEAIEHARSSEGEYTEDVEVAGKKRQVVWQEGRAILAYPPLTKEELDEKPLSERHQFTHFPHHRMKSPALPQASQPRVT